ncbi:RNA polymerase III-inhibiting protein maf1 [Lithohypha guttulata]|nr:RNA polymerase III-inhibiting protein maf1 [Lithohypha guttulata]
MDKYYGNVCELDIIFNFQKAYFILDELILAGEMQESSKKNVLRVIGQQDSLEDMEFVALRDFDVVTSSLNLTTPDLYVLGGCDLYTTKAAGGDKKLYKNIENDLEAQYASDLQFSRSLSPPQKNAMAQSLNLERRSAFGNLGAVSARRIYAYLIATLNASHPDYDFSLVLRPSDFKREKSLRKVMNTFDTTMFNLRPRPVSSYVPKSPLHSGSAYPPNSAPQWGPGMWRLIDQQMSLKECMIYSYAPEEFDPFEDDEAGHMWSMNYFFFNKIRKRVCYLYLRGISILASQDGTETPLRTPIKDKRNIDDASDGWLSSSTNGASKRVRYWFGDRETVQINDYAYTVNNVLSSSMPIESPESFSPPKRPVVDDFDQYVLSDEETRSARSHSTLRGVSEEIVGPIDV